jgi:hypothetical protein
VTLTLPDELVDQLGAAIARHLSAPVEMELLTLQQLSRETGLSYDALRNAALSYEAGNRDGLECMRATEGKSAPIQVKRSWFAAWSERQAARNCKETPIITLQRKGAA